MTNKNNKLKQSGSYVGSLIPDTIFRDLHSNYFIVDVPSLTESVNSSLKNSKVGLILSNEFLAQEIYKNRVDGFNFSVDKEGVFESKIPKEYISFSFIDRFFKTKKFKKDYFIQVFDVKKNVAFYED